MARDRQRHRAARQDPRLRRHVPDLQRLHAPRGAPRRAHAGAVDLRLDARLRRARRRRPDAPADRAARDAPRDPRASTVVRPADANEVARAPGSRSSKRRDGPAGIALTRQNIPVFERGDGEASGDTLASAAERREGRLRARRGADRARPTSSSSPPAPRCSSPSPPASSSQAEGIHARVVSAPCLEWFEEQAAEYRESVLPAAVTARVSVEAGVALTWRAYVGDARPQRLDRALRRLRRLQDPVPRVRHHGGGRRRRREGIARVGLTRARRRHIHMSTNSPTAALSEAGVSIWLDDLSRERITSGGLAAAHRRAQRRRRHHEPDDLRRRPRQGRRATTSSCTSSPRPAPTSTTAVFEITTDDVRDAADIFRPVYDAHGGSTAASRSRSSPASPATPPARSRRPRRCGRRSTART